MGTTPKAFSLVIDRVWNEIGYEGLIAVMNESAAGSGEQVRITDVRVRYAAPFAEPQAYAYGVGGKISLNRISAYSGGEEMASFPFDTNTGALPSQVKIVSMPDILTSDGTIRGYGEASSIGSFAGGLVAAVPFQAMIRAPGVVDYGEAGRNVEGHNVLHTPTLSGPTEPIVLREGEGLAAIQATPGTPHSYYWSLSIRVLATGKTYRSMITGTGTPVCRNDPVWCLFNGAGSGVVLQVAVVNMTDMRESNLPRFRLTRVDAITTAKTEVPISKHDTDAVMTHVKAYRGPFQVRVPAVHYGAPWTYHDYGQGSAPYATGLTYDGNAASGAMFQQRADSFRQFMLGSIYTDGGSFIPILRFKDEIEIYPGERRGASAIGEDDIILNPGEGLALIAGGKGYLEVSEMVWVCVEMTGYTITVAAPTGGGLAPGSILSDMETGDPWIYLQDPMIMRL